MSDQTIKHAINASGEFIGTFVGAPLPDGAVEVATPPSDVRQNWADGKWQPAPHTADQVNIERERRKLLPVTVSLSTGKTFPVDMDNGGRSNVGDLSLFAVIKNGAGDNSIFKFTDANNVDQTLTNDEMIEVGVLCAAKLTAIHESARTLKAEIPIRTDFVNGKHWT